jgi:hypothetical protein
VQVSVKAGFGGFLLRVLMAVLVLLSARNGETIADNSIVSRLERDGFIDKLYGKR